MYAVFEVFLGEVVDGVNGFLGFGLVIAKQNFLNVRQTVAEENVFCTEEANATGAFVEGGERLGGFSIGAFFLCSPCYFAKWLNTHGFRRYALGAYAPLRPAMCSTAARSVVSNMITTIRHYSCVSLSKCLFSTFHHLAYCLPYRIRLKPVLSHDLGLSMLHIKGNNVLCITINNDVGIVGNDQHLSFLFNLTQLLYD